MQSYIVVRPIPVNRIDVGQAIGIVDVQNHVARHGGADKDVIGLLRADAVDRLTIGKRHIPVVIGDVSAGVNAGKVGADNNSEHGGPIANGCEPTENAIEVGGSGIDIAMTAREHGRNDHQSAARVMVEQTKIQVCRAAGTKAFCLND